MIPILADLSAYTWETIAWTLGRILFFIITFLWALDRCEKNRPDQ